jgi:molybdopterin converting factor small subunit
LTGNGWQQLKGDIMAIVHIPALLHSLTGDVRKLEVEGRTVGDLIDQLELLYPGIRDRLVENGHLRSGLAIFVDGMVRREALEYEVPPGSEVLFVPAVAGG